MNTPGYAAHAVAQRRLREALLDRPQTISWSRSRDLAAHLLLYLGDAPICWAIATDWLRTELRSERVDGGFLEDGISYAAAAESTSSEDVPRLGARSFNLRRAGVVPRLWSSRKPLVYANVASEDTLHDHTRAQLLEIHTGTKLVCGITREGQGSPIIFCVDSVGRTRHWTDSECARIYSAVSEVVAPILTTVKRLNGDVKFDEELVSLCDDGSVASRMHRLTAAERQIAELVTAGLSYKELAAKTGRSMSTVDHHLRSIRRKLGVPSTMRLIHLLAS